MEVKYSKGHLKAVFNNVTYYKTPARGCIYFMSGKRKGLGRQRSLHRDVYQAHWGAIPKGFLVHHVDGNGYNNEESNLVAISRKTHQSIHVGGKALSGEHRRKISASLKGIKLSPTHRENISKGRIGMKFSEEHCKHISEARQQANG